ncbi:hypothetical protein [Massilia soli]|uniref:Carboxypeptidase regulatory-like domain-containing protein n=1 Tax=Massilia soli TaxID=2792854 RepID=A0ABS7SUY7_9BURK|nr:hypothetical protein [Massilia soli]MBZ2209764.1 hypothetical protein [Massilia soli]
MKTIASLVLAASCAALVIPVAAQDPGAAAGRPLPEPKTENGVKYVCGGIGMTEAERMKALSREYDLMITFAASNGAYLADIGVEIAHGKDKLLTANCGGPIMLVDVPKAGTYRITADTEGQQQVRTARVRDGVTGKRVNVTWPVRLVDRPDTAARD